MKEINIVTTDQMMVNTYKDTIMLNEALPPDASYMRAVEDIYVTTKDEEYNIRKYCKCIKNKTIVKEYVITDPFLEELLDSKDREWEQEIAINTKLRKELTEKDQEYADLSDMYLDLKEQPLISIFWVRLLEKFHLIRLYIKSKFRRDI